MHAGKEELVRFLPNTLAVGNKVIIVGHSWLLNKQKKHFPGA